MTQTIFSVTLSHNIIAGLQKCIVSDVSSRRSALAQAAATSKHCWLTAAAVVRVRQAKPNEYSWSHMFDLEQNLQHQSTSLHLNCTAKSTEKSGSLYLNNCQINLSNVIVYST